MVTSICDFAVPYTPLAKYVTASLEDVLETLKLVLNAGSRVLSPFPAYLVRRPRNTPLSRIVTANSASHALPNELLTESSVRSGTFVLSLFVPSAMPIPPTSLQAALRKEALAKKRREEKKARRNNEQPVDASDGSGGLGANSDGPSTSARGPPVKASRWDTEGDGVEMREGRRGVTSEYAIEQQSVMARTAHAEIAAFKKLYGGRDQLRGEAIGDRSQDDENVNKVGETLAGALANDPLGVGTKRSARAVMGNTVSGAPKLDDLDELEDLGDQHVSQDDENIDRDKVKFVTEEGQPVPKPLPGPARPDAQYVQPYDEIDMSEEENYEGVDDEMAKARGDKEAYNASTAIDVLVSNKQRLFKRKVSMMQPCRDVDRYEKLNRISEGTYGVVYRGRDLETSTVCALKRLKLENEKAGFPLTSVREINVLLALEHPNIVNVSEVVMGRRNPGDPKDDQIFMVMEYADHDLGSLDYRFSGSEVKCLVKQLLAGVAYLHSNYVMHRDLKPANILYNNRGELKICDFGLARQFSSFPKDYTQMVVTLWYRAPEILLGTRKYSSAIDIWSVGCIMAQLLTGRALLNGQGEIDQLRKTFDLIGTPGPESYLSTLPLWSKCSHIKRSAHAISLKEVLLRANVSVTDELLDLLTRLLDLDPQTRITAEDALDHPWFRCHPLPKDITLMPTFPSRCP